MHGTIKKYDPYPASPFAKTGQNTGFVFDVDECLVPTTIRIMESWKKQLLWDLHDLTDGGVILATNSDLTSIDNMLPGFPCIAEHGSVYRMEKNGAIEITSPALDTQSIVKHAATLIENDAIFSVMTDEQSLQDDLPAVKLEAKMTSVALVFPIVNNDTVDRNKVFALQIADKLKDQFKFGATHNIVMGKDACEIVPKGFAKVNGLDRIITHPNFIGRSLNVFGDSEPDNIMMKAAFYRANGRGFAVGNSIPDAPYIARRLPDIHAVWKLLENEVRSLRCYNRLSL